MICHQFYTQLKLINECFISQQIKYWGIHIYYKKFINLLILHFYFQRSYFFVFKQGERERNITERSGLNSTTESFLTVKLFLEQFL